MLSLSKHEGLTLRARRDQHRGEARNEKIDTKATKLTKGAKTEALPPASIQPEPALVCLVILGDLGVNSLFCARD